MLETSADHQGSIRDVLNVDTGQHNHIVYDSYGNVIAQSLQSLTPRFFCTGREFDAESGLFYYRQRYYDSMQGRFITEDPVGFAGRDYLYQYVASDPVNNIDSFGTEPTVQ